ncbi:hypothetical protein A2774_03635 [Candidatus Roizmanbacteria bacterium RIFCSPHIGHO2_01_FULL_39_12c]|uniref:Glycosyltransferase RgtA/B/C/D-like domain-containing protein n=1 Tax=Candidatus Roizmanbacteria bacterium RIFCSPHIGHO2_01_FULL_39_12c TaxID=1802031 RepID=A0A1F7GFJ9_9BACT|nr:MAG: hypothetical protein A2774_03635 [Candidatus Roizmanbacteria bacterium RIFCSPHIGHO2_01_FULL_39_12c]OGK48155.1 MAG: hypothetical protein A2963_04380 [Candidatus Roizmanbacteria bacterium RIFCSPLOWO2_01_FULL_40_13]
MLKKLWKNYSLVIVISFIVAVLNMLHVFIGYAKTPPGTVFLWTGHYYLDYFEYVQAIAQGQRGEWIWQNYFATDDPSRTFLGIWQFLLYGKIGKLLFLGPFAAYWFFVFAFTFSFVFLSYMAIEKLLPDSTQIKKMAAFLLTVFAAPFFSLEMTRSGFAISNFGFWNDGNNFWERYGAVPYHTLAKILMLVVIFLVGDTLANLSKLQLKQVASRSLAAGLIMIYLLIFSPSSTVLLCAAIGLTSIIILITGVLKKHHHPGKLILFLLLLFTLVIPAGLAVKNYLATTSYAVVSQYESAWQEKPPFSLMFLTIGPIVAAAILGVRGYLKKLTPVRILFITLVISSYGLFYSPIPKLLGTTNSRFLTPLSFILFGVLAVGGFKKIRPLFVLVILLLLLYLPANLQAFKIIMNDDHLFSPISYLPKGIIDGFKFVGGLHGDTVVLLTPSQLLGSVFPIFAKRHVYVARPNITPNYLEKNIRTSNFYLGAMSNEDALSFLHNNKIDTVVLTSIEGYNVQVLFRYPFLEEIYRNKDIIIFKVKD